MANDTLFAYTLEEQQGRLVITVQGAFAEAALRQLRSEIDAGAGLRIISRLSPIAPLRKLLASPGVRLGGRPSEGDTETLDTDDLLNQSVDQNFAAFQQQLNEFRQALNDFKAGKTTTAAAARPRGRRKTAAAAKSVKRARQ